MGGQDAAERIRGRIGAAIIERIAGPRAAPRQPRAEPSADRAGGERWFAEDRPIRQVHSDSAMFIGATTFGRAEDAQRAIARVRAIHQRVTGTARDGRPYAASDPHLLTWVHIAEADSFLRAHVCFGTESLDKAGRDGYVADMARIGAELGVPDPPRTEAELTDRIFRSACPDCRWPEPYWSARPGTPWCTRSAGRSRRLAWRPQPSPSP